MLVGGNLNDKALNAYMKARHSSAVPKIVKVDFIKDLTVFNMMTDDFKSRFTVEPNLITANTECFISIDRDDYSEESIIESTDYFLLPGILDIVLLDDNTQTWTFPFSYPVKLFKPDDFQEKGKTLIFNYVPGEKILQQDSYQKTTDVGIMERMLEGQAKYITKPELLVLSLIDYLGGLDLNIIETLIQNMFRDKTNPSLPARLNDYTNFEIYGQKKLPFVTSWINSLAFENVKKAIQTGLVSGQNAVDDPITRLINEKY